MHVNKRARLLISPLSLSLSLSLYLSSLLFCVSPSVRWYSGKRNREDEKDEEEVIARRKNELEELKEEERKLLAEADAATSADLKVALKRQADGAAFLAAGVREEVNGQCFGAHHV